jgi:hypothetical protein
MGKTRVRFGCRGVGGELRAGFCGEEQEHPYGRAGSPAKVGLLRVGMGFEILA